MNSTAAFDYSQVIPEVLQHMASVHSLMETYHFDQKLTHLVLLRSSQINACGYCVQMHIREARRDGETNERLDRLVIWNQVDDYSKREKAALAWTEALTRLERDTNYSILRTNLMEHFFDQEVGILTATIAMINLWNRIRVSGH
ncbi:carboxymuconolactone decarboxylase family protein [Aestuariirhabdus haliotis]|uniref:carboxymuconolactone decarboxylase family protein n=1 Tax=Aestuariirhabdus haliotis TaxID=2918751 RepID=UPI0020C02F39|nr:carboxymuconolactone decarboxylase family protein [Aestuariirhabdus haliotis]MCL6421217.1 carboxymuconolactone decarboxylase family protein [Aestuariirhabdus haliotis]